MLIKVVKKDGELLFSFRDKMFTNFLFSWEFWPVVSHGAWRDNDKGVFFRHRRGDAVIDQWKLFYRHVCGHGGPFLEFSGGGGYMEIFSDGFAAGDIIEAVQHEIGEDELSLESDEFFERFVDGMKCYAVGGSRSENLRFIDAHSNIKTERKIDQK